jgi:uncharacterized protein
MKKRLAWIVFVAYLFIAAVAWAQPQVPPAPTDSIYIQDYAGVVSPETKLRINNLGSQLAAKTKAQIVVVTTKTLEGASLEEYSLEVIRQWDIGDKTLSNGVLILVAVDDKQSRIEVGYGLEGALPDAKTGRIQDTYMIPYFQKGEYDKGVLNGYLTVATEVAKEYKLELKTDAKPAPRAQAATQEGGWDTLPWWAKIGIAVGVILLLMMDWLFFGDAITYMLLSVLSRRGGGGGGGFGGGSGGGGGSSRKW